MTTIAANLEGMAADTRVTVEGGAFFHSSKIFRIGNSLFGICGDASMGLVMVEWLRTAQRSRHALYKHWTENTERFACELLELRTEPYGASLHVWDGWGVPMKLNEKRFAVGSGQVGALAALDAGADLQEAVRRAAQYDQYSGPPIQIEMLKVVSRKRKR